MFANRYFAPRYFPDRYFPNDGDEAVDNRRPSTGGRLKRKDRLPAKIIDFEEELRKKDEEDALLAIFLSL